MIFYFSRDNIQGWHVLEKWMAKNKYKARVFTNTLTMEAKDYKVMIELREGIDFQPVIDYAERCGVKLVA